MTVFAIDPARCKTRSPPRWATRSRASTVAWVKLTVVVDAADYLGSRRMLRDAPGCQFEQLMDLCGVDYSAYRDSDWEGLRYAWCSICCRSA